MQSKINRKYYGFIWLALILACYVRNVYDIYLGASMIGEADRLSAAILIFRCIVTDGPLPAAITFLCAMFVWSFAARRYANGVSRNDFCYLTMIFAAAAKFVVGVINIFSILEPRISYFSEYTLQPLVMNAAMFLMFFLVIGRRYNLNPVEKYNSFRIYATVFFIAEGILVALGGGMTSILSLIASNPEFAELLIESGYVINEITDIEIAAIASGAGIYVAYVIAAIVVGEILRKKSNLFRNPETRENYYNTHVNPGYTARNTDGNFDDVFGNDKAPEQSETKTKKNVFDEFDM